MEMKISKSKEDYRCWWSYKELMVNALALEADEGRVSGDTLRGAAKMPWSVEFRMGKPLWFNTQRSIPEYIGYWKESLWTETS